MRLSTLFLIAAGLLSGPAPAFAQAPSSSDPVPDYARAESFLGWHAQTLVSGNQVNATWLEDGRFWYRNRTGAGYEFVVAAPARGTRAAAFDHARLASALSVAADTTYEHNKLPFESFELIGQDQAIRFHTDDSVRWECSLVSYECTGPVAEPAPPVRVERPSPDGRWVAFTRDENLWVKEVASGQERQLTTDGQADFGYAVSPEGCCSTVTLRRRGTDPATVLAWSPDSRRLATHQFDERGVEDLHLLETATGRPKLHSYKTALPGDSVIPTYTLHIFEVESGEHVRVDAGVLEAVNTACCQVSADTVWKDVRWGEDSDDGLFFTRGVRTFDTLQLYRADPVSGETSLLIEETSKTYVEANGRSGGQPNWRVIRGGTESVWWSERDGWGHLYRYDNETGAVLNRITSGPWMVIDLLHVDEAGGWVYFTGVGREVDRDPYYRHLYRARLNGSAIELLSPEAADHAIQVSPDGRWFVDTYSTRTTVPVTVVRDGSGRAVMTAEEADFSALLAEGWRWPEPFTVKARDGITDLHGFLYLPSNFDSTRSYPVVDYIYPGPQVGPIGWRQAAVGQAGNTQALAELGFVVFTIDAFGTPARSKSFHDAYYGDMRDNGIPDHIAAIKRLARGRPWMDVNRVGIYGHSGGGFSSTDAILSYPDFFKVAVSSAGNHDNRSYDFTWGEKYHGLMDPEGDGSDRFETQANQNLAGELEGKLLLMYGTLDDNVHPNATLVLIDELIKHNKDYDLIVVPNRNHGYSSEPYVIRRTWDYFVEHLMGVTPPDQFEITRPGGE